MTWRRSFRPLPPEFDKFLFATVGGEIDGIPLSVASGLTRLGLDPWEEAGRLSSLSSREAVEQLARLIAEVPGSFRSLKEARVLADGLVGLLPNHDPSRTSAPQVQIRPRYEAPALPKPSQFWIACLVLAAAALVSAVVHGGLSFGIGSPYARSEKPDLSAKHRVTGGGSVSSFEDRRWPRRDRGDHLPAG
jgi:hypothetical protein